MEENKEIIYPVTKETMHAYAKSIFDPILKGESVTTIWVPMSGRRKWNRFLIENIDLFKEELPNYDKYILAYVEPMDLTEESLNGYLRLIGESFLDSCKKNKYAKDKILPDIERALDKKESTYSELLETLRSILIDITDLGLEVIFFLGEFDELSFNTKTFYKNLKSLWGRLYPRLHYVFLMTRIVDNQDYYYTWDELGEAILQNVIYIPLRSGNDLDYLLKDFSTSYKVQISEEYLQIIKELCGGHPYSLIVSVRVLRDGSFQTPQEFKASLLSNYELSSISTGIYEKRSQKEQEILHKIVQKEKLTEEDLRMVHFLIELGLIEKDGDSYRLYSLLFTQAIERIITLHTTTSKKSKTLTLDEHNGAIELNGETLEENFTRQEYSILTLFLKNPGKVLTRDDIGSVLWGDSGYEKYSDWAIDQLMSKLRKKLRQVGVDVEIHTLRGRGYKFTQNVNS
jgi:DNA-binding winged helix-turn-helix (wHTH) protein